MAVFVEDPAFPQFFWMVVVAIIFGFAYAFAIGANDVANAFGSSVAAKSLTLPQAIVIASTAEFLGALLLGQSVTGAIRNNVLNGDVYEDQAALLMYGMLTSLIIATVLLMAATALEYPVSTTHTIIAAIIGFSIAAVGFNSVNWKETSKIFISWVAAPSISGFISYLFFFAVKKLVLQAEEPFKRASYTFPFVIFAGLSIDVAFVMLKSSSRIQEKGKIPNYNIRVVLPVSVGGAAFVALVYYIFVGPWLMRRVERHLNEEEEARQKAAEEAEEAAEKAAAEATEEANGTSSEENGDSVKKEGEVDVNPEAVKRPSIRRMSSNVGQSIHKSVRQGWMWFAANTFRQDLEALSFSESKRASQIWEQAEHHDPKVERLFTYLQVFTAALTSFSHGANDVANAIAPLAAVFQIYNDGEATSKAPVPRWLLAMGGAGLALGFIFYGYKIIKSLGYKLVMISPSRGFCIELATALAVSVASFLGIPVSSTQCLVGATVGAGVASGGIKSVQWLWFLRITFGWVTLFFSTLFIVMGVFAYMVFGPSLVNSTPANVTST